MIKYEFFDDGKLLITSYIGDIDKELIKSYINFIFTKSNGVNIQKSIADYRYSNMVFSNKDLEGIAQFRNKLDPEGNHNNTVFLVDTPKETAYVNLISEKYYKNSHPAKFCSTLKKCINILSLEIDTDELERRLNELKFEFIE